MVDISDGFTGAPDSEDQGKKSAASLLVELALARYQFGVSEDGQPYAVRPGQHVVRMLRGGKNSLRAELSQAFYQKHNKAVPQQALADALLVLEGQAQEADPSPIYLRVAAADGAVWLDLGDVAENVVRIGPDGWQIVRTGVPVLFRRTALTGVMPDPEAAGHIEAMWEQLNVLIVDQPLVLAWLVAALVDPDMPHPVLSLFGEQGAGKSTASRRLVSMVDPSPVPLRKPPRDPEGWVTAAQGSWVVGLDNLSQVPDWLSDSLCRAATGDGDVRRALYTDAGLAVFAFRRCILLNGIDVGALRGDLADRVLMVNLRRITESARLTERQLTDGWRSDYPQVLGALFTLAADVMRVLPSVRLATKPRMADFARILAAVDLILGTDGLARFSEQANTMAEDSLSADPFLAAVRELVTEEFTGSAAALLAKVTPVDDWRPPRGWPRDPRAVTTLLKRNAPALRKSGWTVDTGYDNHDKVTTWTLSPRHPEIAGNPPPRSPQPPQSARFTRGSSPQSAGINGASSPRSPQDSGEIPAQSPQPAGTAGIAGNQYGQSQDDQLCTVCQQAMIVVKIGQTTHPGCDPLLVTDNPSLVTDEDPDRHAQRDAVTLVTAFPDDPPRQPGSTPVPLRCDDCGGQLIGPKQRASRQCGPCLLGRSA